MTIPDTTKQAINWQLNQWGVGAIAQLEPVSGGCIGNNYALQTEQGNRYFLKTHTRPPPAMFAAEALGLDALRSQTSLQIPQVCQQDEHYLLLEYLEPGQPGANYWQTLAEGLAALHTVTMPAFGFVADNYCGSTPQRNPQMTNGFTFFGEQRLRYQGERALHSRLLPQRDFDNLILLIAKLPELVPVQQPSLIHGDLWRGNIHCNKSAQPVLIDPATYWGWREADIAMTRMFGELPDSFYQHYQACLPMEKGWQQRMPLYNLYHFLNHLNLFGRSYLPDVQQVIKRYL